MRRLTAALVGALLLMACTPDPGSPPAAPGEVVATRDPTVQTVGLTAPGDTLHYTIAWTAGARATGYVVTTTTTGSGWSGLLTNAPTAGLSLAFTPINLTPWDSVTFTAAVASTRAGKPNSAPRTVTWTLVRGPGQPGVPTIDSTQIIAQIILKPDALASQTGVASQMCPYAKALDGKVRFISGYEALPECQGYYDAMPPAETLPGYPVALAHTSTRWPVTRTWSVAVRTPQLELAHLMFAGPFT